MARVIFDIETIGDKFDEMDKTTQEVLTHFIKENAKSDDEYQYKVQQLKEQLGFSPLTGEIVAIGMMDGDRNTGAVYYQSPGKENPEMEENGIKFKSMKEAEMLEAFWNLAEKYDEFVSFNGRAFDIPFIMARSAINKIRPTKDLMFSRYLNSQKFSAKHVDLYDQLSYYGASKLKGGLHMWCQAFGIDSPKTEGIKGDDVTSLFQEGKYLDIAKYNVRDITATKELYSYWEKYMKF